MSSYNNKMEREVACIKGEIMADYLSGWLFANPAVRFNQELRSSVHDGKLIKGCYLDLMDDDEYASTRSAAKLLSTIWDNKSYMPVNKLLEEMDKDVSLAYAYRQCKRYVLA